MFKALFAGLFLGLILLVQPEMVSGQSPARLRCLEVLDNGDVMLHWVPELVGTGAYSYTLYHSSVPSGPYTQLDSITILSQETFIHTGAGANAAPQYYFMYVHRLSGKSAPSDTLASMVLTGTTLDFERVDFTWTPLHVPLESYMHPWYLLYREYPPGNWTCVDSTQELSISYHFWDCNVNEDTVNFRIGVRVDEFLVQCTSLSTEIGNVLKNQTNRIPPVIDSVSIDVNGNAIIGWEPAFEPDIMGYTIFKVTSTNDSIAYVDGRLTTSFTDLLSDPCEGPLTYIILSIDSCGNESPFPYDPVTFNDKPQNTLYLEDIEYDPCYMTNRLAWNDYINFDPPLCCYKIFVSENNGPYNILASLPWTQKDYLHEDLNSSTTYSYFIRAYIQDETKTSTSCTQSITTYDSPRPDYNYIRSVSVENNEQVELSFYTDTSAHVQYYNILRSESPSGPFEKIGQVGEQGLESLSFTDQTADVATSSYYYEVEVVDSCGIATVIANTSRTILLTVDAQDNYLNVLSWNAYESWDGMVDGYRVYRRINDNPSLEEMADLSSTELTYSDDVSNLTGSAGRITYLVEAYEGPGNTWGFKESSFSNEVLAEQEARIYMPNALAPKGVNNVLRPVSVFVASPGYEFQVFNRWGQMIFHTSDLEQGWNGTYNGNYVETGVYVYLIFFKNALNQLQVQKGNVAVIY